MIISASGTFAHLPTHWQVRMLAQGAWLPHFQTSEPSVILALELKTTIAEVKLWINEG